LFIIVRKLSSSQEVRENSEHGQWERRLEWEGDMADDIQVRVIVGYESTYTLHNPLFVRMAELHYQAFFFLQIFLCISS
jgi:hypothetical protein